MEVVKTVEELHRFFKSQKNGLSVGFVPTMGALHRGHIDLMIRARKENSIVVVSIFVNPTQFNNPIDLQNYPKTLELDIKKCEDAGVDIIFAPDEKEVYPKPDKRLFDFGNLDKVMEGKHRPGHFNGVAQVVSKLFDFIKPNRAYFGQKDFQQLAVIQKMVRDLALNIQIVPCPTIREDDGLAMSSRNTLLTPQQRASAPLIAKTLFEARSNRNNFSVQELLSWVVNSINSDPLLDVEYFEISNAETLEPVQRWDQAHSLVACIAVKVGEVRLIDNVLL